MTLAPTPKDRILSLLPQLSGSDMEAVKQRIKATAVFGTADLDDTAKPWLGDWLLEALRVQLVRMGKLPDGAPLQTRKGYDLYKQKRPAVMSYLGTIEKHLSTTSKHRRKLVLLCAEVLADLLKERGVNRYFVTSMLEQIDCIPEALDRAYPGYVAAGLFSFVLER